MKEPVLRLMVAAFRFARAEVVLVGALSLLTLGIMGFVEVADDMTEADGRQFDRIVLEAVREPGDPSNPIGPQWVQIALTDLSALGGVAVLAAIGLIVAGFLLIQKRYLAAMFLITAQAGGLAVSQGLKQFYARERPPEVYRAVEVVNASFPSGHAMLSAVAYLTLGAVVAQALPRPREKIYVMAVAVLLALIVGFSRIYLGVHWASDVLAGWCVGGAWAGACWLVLWGVERWHDRKGAEGKPKGGPKPKSSPRKMQPAKATKAA